MNGKPLRKHAALRYKVSKITVSVCIHLVLISACVIVLLPLAVLLLGSLKNSTDYRMTGVFELPKNPEWGNYAEAFINGNVLLGLKNTLIIILISCTGTIIIGTMTAFVVQRFPMIITKTIKWAFLVAALLPSITMQITVYQIIQKIDATFTFMPNIMNSLAAPVILYVGTDIISIYIFIQYLNNIPISLDESAIIDGASYFRVYRSIILPMLRPAIATVLVIKFISIYNDFYIPNLYIKDTPVVSTALYRFIGPYGAKWEIIFAGVVICIIPSLIIFVFLQKFIYNNLVLGAVKE
jgi:multiple sugar transport system permease protein